MVDEVLRVRLRESLSFGEFCGCSSACASAFPDQRICCDSDGENTISKQFGDRGSDEADTSLPQWANTIAARQRRRPLAQRHGRAVESFTSRRDGTAEMGQMGAEGDGDSQPVVSSSASPEFLRQGFGRTRLPLPHQPWLGMV